MNREATEKLKLDRRLMHRRGWTSKAEIEAALAELPDVSNKIASTDDEASASETDSAPADPDASPPSPPRAG